MVDAIMCSGDSAPAGSSRTPSKATATVDGHPSSVDGRGGNWKLLGEMETIVTSGGDANGPMPGDATSSRGMGGQTTRCWGLAVAAQHHY